MLSLIFFFSVSLVLLYEARKRIGLIQYPFLSCLVMLGWIWPQIIGLEGDPRLPPFSLVKVVLYALLCILALHFGYRMHQRSEPSVYWTYNEKRLTICATILSIFGSVFYYQVSLLAATAIELYGGRWSGAITIYVFLSGMLYIGTIIAAVLHARRPNLVTAAIALYGMTFYLERILVRGRREATVELAVLVLFYCWLRWRRLPSRKLMFLGTFFGALFVSSVGEYRSIVLDTNTFGWSGASFSELLEVDWIGNLLNFQADPLKNQEVLNAAMTISAVDRLLVLDFGASLWNGLIHGYVPGQIIGHDLKESLQFRLRDPAEVAFGHIQHTGTTSTGFADSFRSFWYFGFFSFFLMGCIMRTYFNRAANDSLSGQVTIILLTTPALQAITHGTDVFYLEFVSLAIFVYPVLRFSRNGSWSCGHRDNTLHRDLAQ